MLQSQLTAQPYLIYTGQLAYTGIKQTVAFSYLEPDTVFDAIKDSKKYMRPLFEPLTEFERIARNRPHPNIDKAYPKVTDGTTASVIEKTPRRILQQIPTGRAHSPHNEPMTHVAEHILMNEIIPHANSQFPFLQKSQAGLSKALTYGSQPAYIPFVNRGLYFGTDMLLPYIKDCFLEVGKLSDEDSNYIIMRSWYQKRDIEAIIARGKKLKDAGVDDGWNLQALSDIKDSYSQKDDLSTTPNEKDKNNRQGGIEIMHCFQRGIGATFYSVHEKTKKIVRTKVSKDPRGVIPIHYLYAGTDVSNPIGRGYVEMVGAMQNLMDAEVQMYQYNRALMLNPPMVKRGEWNRNQAKLAPNVLVDLGSNPNAMWEPVKIDSSAINNFPSNYSLMQSQIYQLLSSPSSNVPGSSGSTTQSKTARGVAQTQDNLNTDDRYIRNQTEAWLQKVFETQLNIYYAEKTGIEEVQLSKDTANDIRELDESLVSPDDKIRVNWDEETKQIHWLVDTGSSEEKDDEKEIASLKEIIADVNQNPYSMQYMNQAGKQMNLGEVYKQLYDRLGLENLDKIMTEIPKDANGIPQAPPPMALDRPKLAVKYENLPPAAQVQFLRNAGITVTEQDVLQGPILDPNVMRPGVLGDLMGGGGTGAGGADEHPVIKLMSALNIKFTDLPEDSKREVLDIIGIPTQGISPVAHDQTLKSVDMQHQIIQGQDTQANSQAQLAQADSQHQDMTALQAQSQQASADQAQQSHQLATQQAAQPSPDQVEKDTETPQGTSKVATVPNDILPPNAQIMPKFGGESAAHIDPNMMDAAKVGPSMPSNPQDRITQANTMPAAGSGPMHPTQPPALLPPQQPQPQPSDSLSPQDHQLLDKLLQMGLSEPQAGQTLALIHHGYSPEQAMKMLQGAKQ